MRFRQEFLRDGHEEFDALIHHYYAVTDASKDVPPLCFDWSFYLMLEDTGKLVTFTVRTDQLDGFAQYFVVQNVKHPSMLLAACDTLAVRPEMRGHGIGRQLVEFATGELKALGCTHMTHGFRMTYRDEVPLFEKIGFRLYEKVYMKELS
jgi:GNAT superfamily N-acetyltransferase